MFRTGDFAWSTDAGAMGLTNNYPSAMNGAIPLSTRFDGHKVVFAPHDVKYGREDHDQCEAEGSKQRKLRLTRVIVGTVRPTSPRNSQAPMKTNKSCGTAEN